LELFVFYEQFKIVTRRFRRELHKLNSRQFAQFVSKVFADGHHLIFLHFAREIFNLLLMDSKLILEAARGTLDGTLSFPEVVGQLLAAGVEYYHVDYVGLRKRFYSAEGGMVATSINYENLPPVAPEFDAVALRANILDSQRNGQPYREFTRRAMAGGVQGYIAFLRGQRVTYWGRSGDQHNAVPGDCESRPAESGDRARA
jgi:uncharacterized protein YbcV (DUF1398 family)